MLGLDRKFLSLKCHSLVLVFLINFLFLISFTPTPTASASANPIDEPNPPASVAIILDLSKSMASDVKSQRATDRFNRLLEALAGFVQMNHQQNEYFIIGVSTEPVLLMDWQAADTTLSELSKYHLLPRDGGTSLFDACYVGVSKVTQGRYPKKAIVVISDGNDTISEMSFEAVLGVLRDKKVPLYAIDNGYSGSGISVKAHQRAMKNLDEMASVVGGAGFHPKEPVELSEIFRLITEKLKSR